MCAVDIGSSKIAAVVAQTNKGHIVDLWFEQGPCKGVRKGVITDSIDLVDAVGSVLKKLKGRSGIPLKSVFVNIPGHEIVAKHSRAVIPLAERGNKVITAMDVERVNEQARILGSSLDEEIIHQLPLGYAIDSQNGIVNPLGLYSHRLEVDLYLLSAKLSTVQSLNRAINQAGFEIKDLFFSGLSVQRALAKTHQQQGYVILCDIGSDSTDVLIAKDGFLVEVMTLAIGGDSLTQKLADALSIPFDLAEDVKRSYGSVIIGQEKNSNKEILVKKNNAYKPIKQALIVEVLAQEARVIGCALQQAISGYCKQNAGVEVVVAGRTVLLDGFLETLEHALGVSVRLARIGVSEEKSDVAKRKLPGNNRLKELLTLVNQESNIIGQKYLTYLTAVGMLSEACLEGDTMLLRPAQAAPHANPVVGVIQRLKDLYQEYF